MKATPCDGVQGIPLLTISPDTLRVPHAALHIEEARSRDAFVQLEAEWNALIESTDNRPFYRHEFFRAWLDNFAPRDKLRVLLARGEDGSLVGALALLEKHSFVLGVPVHELVSVANDHSPRFDLFARDPQLVGPTFIDYLAAQPGWDVLILREVPEGGNAWHIYRAARQVGMPSGTWDTLLSPYVPLPSTFDEMQARLPSKLKANLRRRRRKLEEMGKVTFERVTGGVGLPGKLEEGYLLERSGWKGESGTAIAQDRDTSGFYTDLAHAASYHDYLSLYFLRLDGRPVAFHYGMTYAGCYYVLKPAYDEAISECSPGQLLMHEVLRDCIERGLSEFDFLGPDMIWKRDWAVDARQHSWLFVFNRTLYGRLLHLGRFKLFPVALKLARRWRKRA